MMIMGITLIILYIGVVILAILVWYMYKDTNNDEEVKTYADYLFVYKIVEGDPKGLPTEFLVNWKISNLENHLYLLYLTLEEDLDIEEYLHKAWVGYSGWENIYGKVYRTEGIMDIRNILIGTWEVVEGRIGYSKVG